MSTTKTNNKVYGLFYKSHGTWRPYVGNNSQALTLTSAQTVKNRLKRLIRAVFLFVESSSIPNNIERN